MGRSSTKRAMPHSSQAPSQSLTRLVAVIQRTPHDVMIEGHTDAVPIQTARYASNWELSTARAISAMHFLVHHGVDADRVGVAGYADVRPLPAQRERRATAANRRVEFVFVRVSSRTRVASPPRPSGRSGPDQSHLNSPQGGSVDLAVSRTRPGPTRGSAAAGGGVRRRKGPTAGGDDGSPRSTPGRGPPPSAQSPVCAGAPATESARTERLDPGAR